MTQDKNTLTDVVLISDASNVLNANITNMNFSDRELIECVVSNINHAKSGAETVT